MAPTGAASVTAGSMSHVIPSDRPPGEHAARGTSDHAIEFDDSCVMIDTDPLSIIEDGIRKKLSAASISGPGVTPRMDETDDKTTTCRSGSGTTGTVPAGAPYNSILKNEKQQPQVSPPNGSIPESQTPPAPTRRRLSLSSLINNLPALPVQPTTKLRALVRKLSSSPLHSLHNQSDLKSTPAPPVISSSSSPSSPRPTSFDPFPSRSTPKRASTMPVVPRISTSTIPSSPMVVAPFGARKFTTTEIDREIETDDDDAQVIVVDSRPIKNAATATQDLASSARSSTLTVLDEDAAYFSPTLLTPQQDYFVPSNDTTTSFGRRGPFISRNSSFGDDLTTLSEVDESEHYDRSYIRTSASAPTSPVAQSTKVCTGVWLCSRPPRASCPIQARQVSPTLTVTNPLPPKKVNRPLVVRSMSTGRLAREFDDQGRVICLSVHSDRVLGPSVSPPPPTSRKQCWLSVGSRSTPGLLGSNTYQTPRRVPTSPSVAPLNKLGLPAQPVRTISNSSKQSSTERLVRVPSSSASTLSRATSIGSWKKKAWQLNNRSVRV
ncbi:hypothetical protein IAU59_000689 [Kwoniella sp. CBS 9459]